MSAAQCQGVIFVRPPGPLLSAILIFPRIMYYFVFCVPTWCWHMSSHKKDAVPAAWWSTKTTSVMPVRTLYACRWVPFIAIHWSSTVNTSWAAVASAGVWEHYQKWGPKKFLSLLVLQTYILYCLMTRCEHIMQMFIVIFTCCASTVFGMCGWLKGTYGVRFPMISPGLGRNTSVADHR